MWFKVFTVILVILLMVNFFSNMLGSSPKTFLYTLNSFAKLNASFDSTIERFEQAVHTMEYTDEIALDIIEFIDGIDFKAIFAKSEVIISLLPNSYNPLLYIAEALNHVYTILSLVPKLLVCVVYIAYLGILFFPVLVVLGSDVAEFVLKFIALVFDLILRNDPAVEGWEDSFDTDSGGAVLPNPVPT